MVRSWSRRCLLCALLSTSASLAPHASAQSRAPEIARAEHLFEEANALLKQGDVPRACSAFAESQKLDPQIGTLLNLAVCREREGKTATAWSAFIEVVSLASRAGQVPRANLAKQHAKALERKLSRVTFSDVPDGAAFTLDGQEVEAALVRGTALPLDPGTHQLTLASPGRTPASVTFEVPEGPATTTVRLPEMQFAEQSPAPREPQRPPPLAAAPAASPSPGGGQRTVGYVTAAAGVLALTAGAVLGGLAIAEKNRAEEACVNRRCPTRDGIEANERAGTFADVSTALFVTAAVALAVGTVLVVSSPRRASTATALYDALMGAGNGVALGR